MRGTRDPQVAFWPIYLCERWAYGITPAAPGSKYAREPRICASIEHAGTAISSIAAIDGHISVTKTGVLRLYLESLISSQVWQDLLKSHNACERQFRTRDSFRGWRTLGSIRRLHHISRSSAGIMLYGTSHRIAWRIGCLHAGETWRFGITLTI